MKNMETEMQDMLEFNNKVIQKMLNTSIDEAMKHMN